MRESATKEVELRRRFFACRVNSRGEKTARSSLIQRDRGAAERRQKLEAVMKEELEPRR